MLVGVVAYIFGWFVELLSLFTLVLIHELGHVVTAKLLGWHITKIVIWPFGGVMETSDYYNRPFKEEWFVTIAGPLQHIWLYGLIALLSHVISQPTLITIWYMMNTAILCVNLLPIQPLDGGRLLALVLFRWLSFYRVLIIMVWFSIVLIVGINAILWTSQVYSLHWLILSLFLLLDNWFLWRQRQRFLLKHLLGRYLQETDQEMAVNLLTLPVDQSIDQVVKRFKRFNYHYVYFDNGMMLSESDCLRGLFTRFNKHELKMTE
ncbi:site-2 protease family protein [Alkalibacillus flavidus]